MGYDLFISHSSKDKEKYILPLCQNLENKNITYWLDFVEIEWGDNLVDKINRGISESKYMLICLSENFLSSNWTNSEFTSTFSMQNNEGRKKTLPLILNSKDKILKQYPLLNSLTYKDISVGLDNIANSLSQLIYPDLKENKEDSIKIFVESKYTGKSFEFNMPKTASFKFLRDRIINVIGLNESADIGISKNFQIKWVLVDSNIDQEWKKLNTFAQSELVALIKNGSGINKIVDAYQKLQESGVIDSTKFYLYPVADPISFIDNAFFS